ncbi:sulfate transporter family-domain-containing protein [Halteromyces radiatus]|uniref:sulfate transporter family-domain-containing protein n=1 Tax=Halteromyces radiatus TaxID=101107 RepID=UPI002220CD7E|nr:sulfate transporter family-domain-containing protein [Halteromyces radiatus]KAI8093170.1 sulfate transporter family-domain-containing protein [Halteromyces radiatus]
MTQSINNHSFHTTYQILHYDSDSEYDTTQEDQPSETQALLGLSNQTDHTRYMAASPIQPQDDFEPRDTWTLFKVRSKYYLPILQWLPMYNCNLFFGDLFAGLTISCLMIPLGLSYATALCKLEAIHGLYGIAFPAITYAIFGTSRQMSVGPEAPLALLVGSSIAQQQHMKDYQIDPLAWACLMTFFIGLFTFLLGIFRLGFLDSLMSRALLRGFITGVAIVVMVQQSIMLLGLVEQSNKMGLTEASTSLERLVFLFNNIQYAHPLSSMVSIISILFLLCVRTIKSKWYQSSRWMQLLPEVLFMVITAILLTWYFRWDLEGLQILGHIKNSGIPIPSIPSFPPSKHMKDMLVTAAMIAIIGFVESIVIAKTYSSRHNYSVSANRELVALGMANIASGLFQGIPAYGSVARSKINDRAGASTQMAGLISGLVAVMAILFLLPYFYYLPRTVLSSIIFVAVLSLLSELPEDLHFIFKIGAWRDLALLLVTFTATMIISLEFGTLLAVTLSLILTIRETSYPRISMMGRVKGTRNKFKPIQGDSSIEHLEDVLIIRIEEPLFFANTGQLKERLRRLEIFGDMSIHPSESPRLNESSFTIFDVGSMPYIDASAVQILMEIVLAYHARQVSVFFVKLRSRPMATFEKSGLLDLVGKDHIFSKVSDAIEAIEKEITV